jgi:hypothetical protein
MDGNRRFEKSELTEKVLRAIEIAIDYCRDYEMHVEENNMVDLLKHIEKGEFDIRLMSRVE